MKALVTLTNGDLLVTLVPTDGADAPTVLANVSKQLAASGPVILGNTVFAQGVVMAVQVG